MVRDSHPVSVAAKVAKYLPRPAEGRLGIDDPILSMKTAQQLTELLRVSQPGTRSGAA